jgi:hypothetical protein
MDKSDVFRRNYWGVRRKRQEKEDISMRMVTFLLGGIVGACAVVYMNQKNGMMLSNLSNAGQSVGNMVNKAKSKFSNMNMDMDTNNNMSGNSINRHSKHDEGLDKVEKIVKKDPNLKNKVDEILADNNQNTSSFRVQ